MAGRPRPRTAEDIRLGRRVMAEREVAGLNTAQMAEFLGVEESVYKKIEQGHVALTAVRAAAICGHLKISLKQLFTGEPDVKSVGESTDESTPPTEAAS